MAAAFSLPIHNDYDSALAAVSEGKHALMAEEVVLLVAFQQQAEHGKYDVSHETGGYSFENTPPDFKLLRDRHIAPCIVAHKGVARMGVDDAKIAYMEALCRSRYYGYMCWWVEIDNPKSKPRFSLKKWEPRVRAWLALSTDSALVLKPGAEDTYYSMSLDDVKKATLDSQGSCVVVQLNDKRLSVTLYSEENRAIHEAVSDVLEQKRIANMDARGMRKFFKKKGKKEGKAVRVASRDQQRAAAAAPPPSLKEIEAGAGGGGGGSYSDAKMEVFASIDNMEDAIRTGRMKAKFKVSRKQLESCVKNYCKDNVASDTTVLTLLSEVVDSVDAFISAQNDVTSDAVMTACQELRECVEAVKEIGDVSVDDITPVPDNNEEAPPAYAELMGGGAASAATASEDIPEEWSAERVGEWLESIGVEPGPFVAEEVDGFVLMAATNEWLKEDFNLTSGGRRKLLMARDDLFGFTE